MNDSNKPDWKGAPEWAQWLAQDADGTWYWYESTPFPIATGWLSYDGECLPAASPVGEGHHWLDSRESRPQDTTP